MVRSVRSPIIRTPDQRLRVFVSSTMKELAAERAAVAEAVRALRLAPVLFELGARPHPPRDLYVAYLQQSDIFVGIYGREYGWIAPGMDISGIEDEYLLARDKPRLLYVKAVEGRDERLKAMLERIAAQGDVSYKRFSSAEKLSASGQMADLRDRHSRFHARPAGDEDSAPIGLDADAMVERSDRIYADWREAVSWGVQRLEEGHQPPPGLETLLVYLPYYWYLSGRLSEGRELSEGAVRAARGHADGRILASALSAAGAMALWQGDIAQARRYHDEAVCIWRRQGDPVRLRQALMWLGQTLINQGESHMAGDVLTEVLALLESESPPTPHLGIALMHLGDAALQQGQYEAAEAYFQRGLANQREMGSPWGVASLLNSLGETARCQGDYQTARRYYEEAVNIFRRMKSIADVARGQHSLGYVALRQGDLRLARERFCDALAEFRRLGHPRGLAEAVQGLAGVAAASGAWELAGRLLGASERMLAEVQAQAWPADRLERERDARWVERALGPAGLAEAIATGHRLSSEEAVDQACRA